MTSQRFELPRTAEAVQAAREIARGFVDGSSHDVRRDDLALLVSELVTNSVRHGSGNAIELTLSRNESLRAHVVDRGGRGVPRIKPVSSDRPGGWGLLLVDRIADDWGVDTDGATRVWFVLS